MGGVAGNNATISIVTFSQGHSEAQKPRPLIREKTWRFIIYIRRTSLRGLAYTARAVARHLNCRRVRRGD